MTTERSAVTVQEQPLAGAKHIAGWFGRSERWLRKHLERPVRPGRPRIPVHRLPDGGLFALPSELLEFVKSCPYA